MTNYDEHYYMSAGKPESWYGHLFTNPVKLSFTTVKYYEQWLLKSTVTIEEVQNSIEGFP